MTEPTTPAGRDLVRRIWDGWHPSRSEQNEAEFAAIVLAIEEEARAEGRQETVPLDIELLAEAIANTYIAPSGSRLMDAENAATKYARLIRHGRSSDPEPAPDLDVDALRQALATVYHWAMPEDEEDDAEEILRVNQIAAEYARIRGAAPALQTTGEPPHE